MSECTCKRCRDTRTPTWWLSPSQLQELLLSGACRECGTFTCPHALDHDAMCPGTVPGDKALDMKWFVFLDGTYTVDEDNS